ncbi:MAG: FAD-binding oxidoreductase [Deltaproteobacteria bacterium]|nr:FAD-binding oxidoreductase [Deltaproteobacteria bacterium]
MKKHYRVVIIGAGIMGLSAAYHLARRGITDVLVIDRGYLCGGASGRNGGGVRAQFSSETNIRLMRESIEICRDFATEMKINVWFRQGGYLFLTRSKAQAAQLEASAGLQKRCGLATRLLSGREVQSIVPEIDTQGVELASFNPDDGVVFPWPFLWGYAQAAEALGVELATFTEVEGFATDGKRITSLALARTAHDALAAHDRAERTSAHGRGPQLAPESHTERPVQERFSVSAETVLCCAGAWSPNIAKMLDISLPNVPHRHEICSTEPLKPWLGPLVADLSNGLYFSQSARGEIVGGVSVEPVPHGINQRSSVQFLATYAQALVRTVPSMASVKVLRQWAGCYDLTPDQSPIVGRVDGCENFVLACGFMGHGFMMAPVMGRHLAEHIATEETSALFAQWNLRRFAEGNLLKSESMIIG